MLADGAAGAVVSLLSSPPTVAPLPMLNVLPTLIAPSARLARIAAGTVAVQVPAPVAGAVAVLPAESISVTPGAGGPGCETPVMVRSPASAELIIARLAPLASLGEYGAEQPDTGPGAASAS